MRRPPDFAFQAIQAARLILQPGALAHRYLLRDRDRVYGLAFKECRTSYQSPWQNGVAERFVATVRRELLDHVIVLNEGHLRKLLGHFLDYYHLDRTHLGLDKDSPLGRPVGPRPHALATVAGLPRVEGLHRRYYWRQAA